MAYNALIMTAQARRAIQEPREGRPDKAISRGASASPAHARVPAWAPMLFGVVALAISLVGLVLLVLNRDVPKSDRWGFWGFQSLMGVVGSASGRLITRRYPRHPIGWMLLLAGFSASLTGFSEEFALFAKYIQPQFYELGVLIAGLFNWWWVFGYALLAIFIPLLFPDGRLLTRRWRIVAWLGAIWMVVSAVWMIVYPGPLPNNGDVPNPFGVEALRGGIITEFDPRSAIPLSGMFLMLAAATSLLLRYRRAQDPVTRQQLKWLVFASVLASFAGMIGHVSGSVAGIVLLAMALSPPVAIAIAILRYRLYDIDIIISRTLVYGTLVALIVGVYAVLVGATSLFIQNLSNWSAAVIAAGVVAILFHPVRTRLQQGVNRLLYGRRDQPLVVLSELGERMEAAATPEDMLPVLVQTVAGELKLPYVAVGLESDGQLKMAAEYGQPTAEAAAFPLSYQGEQVGQLLAAPRQRGESFSASDVALLENVARQAGAVAHAVRLTAELRRSRQRLVTAREEERRRLRRDLHDGLGPHLASMTLSIEAAMRLINNDPQSAIAFLEELKGQSQTAVREIRRLVYDLRPPALDDLGLTGALRESAARYSQSGVRFTIDAPDPMPPLPAAVEVAAFRIAQEGMTNVVRHAAARTCRIILRPESDCLCVTIEDDGRGLSSKVKKGVGLSSMQERVAELEGSLALENRPQGGAIIRARLPLVDSI
ncbi:MAG: hypothetical protein D6775_16250 [Caldilineae bacterium]|nr:MAG: hypothetical protein D6775_16250 [Caldilineae bacterium]